MVNKTKEIYKTIFDFIKQLMRLTVTAAFVGLGTYSTCQGRHLAHAITAKGVLLVFAGVIVAIYGLIELYKTLIRKV